MSMIFNNLKPKTFIAIKSLWRFDKIMRTLACGKLCLLTIFLFSCVNYDPAVDKPWVRNHIDTGEFYLDSLTLDKAVFKGSVSPKYSNLDFNELAAISSNTLTMLQDKYGAENIFHANELGENKALFEIYYDILDNSTALYSDKQDYEECFYSVRNMSLELRIINTETELPSWGGILDNSLSSTNCKDRQENEGEGFFEFILEGLLLAVVEETFDELTGTYKNPPSSAAVVETALSDFYSVLP